MKSIHSVISTLFLQEYSHNQRSVTGIRELTTICGPSCFVRQMKISVLLLFFILSLFSLYVNMRPAIERCAVKEPLHSSHAYSSTRALALTHTVKDNLALGQGIKTSPGQGSWSSAKQDSYKVEHGRPHHVCRDLKPLFLKLCLRFVRCSSWTVHREVFSYPFLYP